MQYIIYCRKSTDSEDRQVLSIDAQERELLEIAQREGLKVIKTFKESMSAKDMGRPVFNEMISYLQKNNDIGILTWKIDRLARNLLDGGVIINMLQHGMIKVIRTYDRTCLPTDNVLMLALEFGMANQYVRDLSVNVKRGNREKLSRGEWPNHAPFGYLNDKTTKTIQIDQTRAPFVVRAFELYASGMSYKDIADTLYAEGLRAKSGRKVYESIFQRIIQKRFYFGIMEREGKFYPGKHEPIISKSLFDKAQAMSELGSRPREQKLFFPLRGFMRCGSCDCLLTASLKKGHHYYYCTNGKEKCEEHKSYLRENYLYPLISELFKKLRFDEEIIEIMYEAARQRLARGEAESTAIVDNLTKTLQTLKSKENRLLDSYLSEQIEKDLYEAKMREIANEKIVIEQQLKQARERVESPESTLEPIKNIFLAGNRATKEFLEADEYKKEEMLKNLLWNLSIKDKNIVSYSFKREFSIIEKSPKTGDFSMLLPD